MRLREFFYLMGFKPSHKFYSYRIQKIELPKDGVVEFARWLAPKYRNLSLAQSELDELRTFIHEGDFAIDVGAHIGDSTLPIALACGASGAVVAFEPNPATFAILGANSALNPKRTNIIPLPFAVTQKDTSLTFDYGDPWLSNGGDHTGMSKFTHGSAFSIPVEGRWVEPIIRDKYPERLARLRYIKTDVEGGDLAALNSMSGLIKQFRPYVKSEISWTTTPADRESIYKFFADLNYELRLVKPDTLFGPPISREEMFCENTIEIFAIP